MALADSYLSGAKYGYDFVVAVSEAAIDAGLKQYLTESTQPATALCFLADPQTGDPTEQITLDALKAKTGGVDPFTIPADTAYDDPRIAALTKQRFVAGVKLRLGLPPGVLPKNMPPVVQLGTSANNVAFNLFCSELDIIQNTPPNGFGGKGQWNVWSQPSGTPWYFGTTVDLVMQDLSKELDTPYFKAHPDKRAALLAQLGNLGSQAFSLQQLLFDLDNAALQSVPHIEGLPKGSNAASILSRSFVDLYAQSAKAQGEPLLAVHAVSDQPGTGSLALTGMEREVSPLRDGNGAIIDDPTPQQKAATTLDYLCATDHKPLPGVAGFAWNWIEPDELTDESGVIAINRNTLGQYYIGQLMPHLRRSCIGVSAHVTAHALGKVNYSWTLSPGKTPQTAKITESGADVVSITFSDYARGYDKSGLTAGEVKLWSDLDCTVSFSGTTVTVVQHLVITVYARWDDTDDKIRAFDKTITDTYHISVDQNGHLQATRADTKTADNSQSADRSGFVNFFTGINDLINDIKKKITGFVATQIDDVPAANVRNFVFPAGDVFAFKAASFSDHQDLVTRITYAAPK
jgi:hypothetical protein